MESPILNDTQQSNNIKQEIQETSQYVQAGGSTDDTTSASSKSIHDSFDTFLSANDLLDILSAFEFLKESCGISAEGEVYSTIRDKVAAEVVTTSTLWKLLDSRMTMSEYESSSTKVMHAVVVGAGMPCMFVLV